ncbi:MAG: hypothetical protein LBU32_16830 [Clostridiales bacterium]|nr:hypothetical protein [Clostridiales bacterium]
MYLILRLDMGLNLVLIATNTRIRNNLEKDHAVDARRTGGNPRFFL